MGNKETLIRSISGIFIMVIMLSFIYSYNIVYDLFFIISIGSIMGMEWSEITAKNNKNKNRWFILGTIYIIFTLLPLFFVKTLPDGNHFLMWLFILVWSTDTFAYIVGAKLKLGKHKINAISPKKSYEGLIGGTLFAILFCYLFSNKFLPDYKNLLLFITPIFCCLEQAGDFTESYIKRKFNVKDSGSIIPGHGGFLDRFDGFLYITTFLLMILNHY